MSKSLQDPDLALKMEFITQPPPSVYAHDVLRKQVVVCFVPYVDHHTTPPRFTPWVPGPGERLFFECEFITEGSNPKAVPPFPYYFSRSPLLGEDELPGGPSRIAADIRISPDPGNYILQVTGYILREGMDPVALNRISSDPIEVLEMSHPFSQHARTVRRIFSTFRVVLESEQ